MSRAPHNQGDTSACASPLTNMLIIVERCSTTWSAWAGLRACLRCQGRKPEGPAPECLLKDLIAVRTASASMAGTVPGLMMPKFLVSGV